MEPKNKSTPGQRHLMEVYASIRDMLPESNRGTWRPFVRMGRLAKKMKE
jgi:hypothetical protein